MARIHLGADDERVIVAALEGYGRHLRVRRERLVPADFGSPDEFRIMNSDIDRAERLARVIKTWRDQVGEPAPDVMSEIEDGGRVVPIDEVGV